MSVSARVCRLADFVGSLVDENRGSLGDVGTLVRVSP